MSRERMTVTGQRKLTTAELEELARQVRAAYEEYEAGLALLRSKGNEILSRVKRVLVEEKVRRIESGQMPVI